MFGALTKSAVFASSRHCWWNMDSLLYARDQGIIKTMDFSDESAPKNADSPIGRKGHSNDFLGCEGNIPHGLFRERRHDHGAVLQWIIRVIRWEIKRDMTSFGQHFPNMKTWLTEKKFSLNEIFAETEAYFDKFDKLYFFQVSFNGFGNARPSVVMLYGRITFLCLCSYRGRSSRSARLKRINCVRYRSPVMVSFGFNSL